MKWRTIFWRRMNSQGISSVFFLMLSLTSVALTGSEVRTSVKNLAPIKNVNEPFPTPKIDSKILNIETESSRNSPALNSFLKNVLQAQDELKWIDEAVRRTGTKESQEKSPTRYLRSSFRHPGSRHQSRIRSKRRSGSQIDRESWTPTKLRYRDDDIPERVYLDNEIKVKRHASPSPEFNDQRRGRSSRKNHARSADDDGQPVDDSTLRDWAKKEKLEVPGDWFEPRDVPVKNQWSRSGYHENKRREIRGSNRKRDWMERREVDEPTLESLKKTVLELKKSLEDSDKKMDSLSEKEGVSGLVQARERHPEVEEEVDRDKKSNFDWPSSYEDDLEEPSSSKMEVSEESNWWEDPRSAVDTFDFRRRDDDTDDEEEDSEDSEFDYMSRRVKRDRNIDGEERKVRVYRRAGFGELYPDEEGEEEEKGDEGKASGVFHREIREVGTDKINDEHNSDGVERSGDRKSADINVNENGHSTGTEIKNLGDDNPAEKSGVFKNDEENRAGEKASVTVGDSNLEDGKKPGFLSRDEKRESSSPQGLSTGKIPRVDSAQEKIPKISKPEKTSEEKTSGENEARNTEEEKKEVEKSEPTDDDVHRLSQDTNQDKKPEDQEKQKDVRQLESSGEKKSEKKEAGTESENEMIKKHEKELAADKINDEIKAKEETEDKDMSKNLEPSNGIGKIDADDERDSKLEDATDDGKVKLESNQEAKNQVSKDSKDSKLLNPTNLSPEVKNTDLKNSKDEERKGEGSENDVNKSPEESSEEDRRSLATPEKDVVPKREDLTRKLLWLSNNAEEGSKDVEIRDGRRDSSWDQNHGEKSGQRPANYLKNTRALHRLKDPEDEVKFVKRSLMVARDSDANIDLKKRTGIRSIKKESVDSDSGFGDKSKQLGKRSVQFYPENVEEDDRQDLPQSDSGKRSMRKIIESRRLPDLADEIEDDVSRDEENLRDPEVNNEGEENRAAESEASFSHQDRDRDPMRDRINMLIKQKLDDRGKGKLTHVKREANRRVANIEYYDYDSDVNGGDSDADSTGFEDNQQIPEQNNSTFHEIAIDKAPEAINKTDENAEEERREELERDEGKYKPPKEEFISDVELGKTQTEESIPDKTTTGLESPEKSYRRFNEDEVKGAEPSTGNQAARSNDHWLGQPAEADPEQDSMDRRDRYQGAGEPGEREKVDNAEVLGEPLEYSVNVHGKLDPESIDAELNEKVNTKDKDLVENEKRSDKTEAGNEEDWKCEGSRSEEKIEDDQSERDREYEERSSGGSRRYRGGSARTEEGTNDRESSRSSFSHNGNDPDVIVDGLYPKESLTDEEVGLVEEAGGDSLPTMLDRSGPGNPAPGERAYLVIAPAQVQCPQKPLGDNSSSSSSSGSNYLALKVTDDMFKGGVEQGNPTDDRTQDGNVMGKTTTEWKVIKVAENSKAKPHFEGSLPEEKSKFHPNLAYEDDSRSLKDLAVNPRDVVHESIVDPEEMAGDFDDDTRPRFGRDLKCLRESDHHFGRSLRSVSQDNIQAVHEMVNSEKPVDKYLEGTQTSLTVSEAADHRVENGKPENLSETENGSIGKNVTEIVKAEESLEKRSFGFETLSSPDGENETEIDKDKRGLTNVEEWEMNAPSVQKQHLVSPSQNVLEDLSQKGTSEVTGGGVNAGLVSTPKTLLSDFYEAVTSSSHERESRSVKLKDENFGSELFPVGQEYPGHNRRSNVHRKKKSRDTFRPLSSAASRSNPFAKYGSIPDSNPRYDYDLGNAKGAENSGVKLRPSLDWKKSHHGENVKEIRHQSKDYHSNHARRKSAKEDGPNRRHHQHNSLAKHHDKDLKEISSHGSKEPLRGSMGSKAKLKGGRDHEEKGFEDIEEEPVLRNVKADNKMTAGAAVNSQDTSQSKSSQNAGEGSDSENAETEGDKKVLDESAGDPAKVKPELEAPQKKKFTVLLAADNMEDESQMDLALHGELAGKIVERIFDQVQKNDALKLALGPGLYRKHKSEDAIATDKIYRQGLDEDEVKHTEGMMRRVMELLGRLILDEVQRKTCASLPPDMREFLQWMLGVEDEDRATDQVPPLPFVPNQEPNHRQDDKFLFEHPSKHYENVDVNELNRKVRLLRSLIHEYNALTDKEKTKVQMVHDYLVRQLGLLLDYIETREAEGSKPTPEGATGRVGGGNILQYQNAVPNANGSMFSGSTLSPLVNTPSILMLSNASFVESPRGLNSVRSRLREIRSSDEDGEKKHKKRKHKKHKHPDSHEHDEHKHKHKKNKKKKNKKKHRKHKEDQSPEYKKLIRRAAMLRKKRANLYEDNWDPIDSGYEEPAIYTSTGQLTNKRNTFWKEGREKGDPHFWEDVLSGKLDGDEEFGEKLSSDVINRGEKMRSYDESAGTGNVDSEKLSNSEIPEVRRNSIDEEKVGGEKTGSQIKRDVLSASIALQPWLNPKPDDLVSSEYLKDLTTQLVHGSLVPPMYPGSEMTEEKKGEAGMSEGRNLADDEVALLSKREAWKTQNEQQLEEVAFGKDMRGKWKEKEQFEKLTEIDKKKKLEDGAKRRKREGDTTESSSLPQTRDNDSGPQKSDNQSDCQTAENIDDQIIYKIGKGKVPEEVNHPKKEDAGEKILGNVTFDNEKIQNLKNLIEKGETNENVSIKGKDGEEDKKSGVSSVVERSGDKKKREFLSLMERTGSKERIGKNLEGILAGRSKSEKESNEAFEDRKTKRSSAPVTPQVEGSAILPLLEVSEQRQAQKQAAKTEKDDQRDIADQMLGYSSPLILNTY